MSTARAPWLVCAWALFACSQAELEAPAASNPAAVSAALEAAFEAGESTQRVIVNLHEPETEPRAARHRAMRARHDAMLEEPWPGLTLRRRYRHIPAFAAIVTREGLEHLRRDSRVAFIQVDGLGSGQLAQAVPAIGGDRVHSVLGLTGRGVRVAVLDTGIDTDHPDLADSLVAEQCFTRFDCPPLRGLEGTSAEDNHGHGSHVTGIISSDGVVAPIGFAPDAEIVSVKINDFNDSGYESDWAAGLDWIYDNLEMLDVRVVNMSICTNALAATAAQCDAEHPALARAVMNLVDAGVTLFAASGNRGMSTMMSAPACNTGVIAVGATYDSAQGHQPPAADTYFDRWGPSFADCGDDMTELDQVTCFTNSNARLDLLAPGAPMVSDALGGQTDTYWGTSQASPVAAAIAALMLECDPALTPAEIKAAMLETGVPRLDPKNGLSFPSLRALEAVQTVCEVPDAGVAGAAGMAGSDAGAGAAGASGEGGSGGASGAAGMGAMMAGGAGGAGGAAGSPVTAGSEASGASGGTAAPIAGASAGMEPIAGSTGPLRVGDARSSPGGCSCRVLARSGSSQPVALASVAFALAMLGARRVRRAGR